MGNDVSNNLVYSTLPENSGEQLTVDFGWFCATFKKQGMMTYTSEHALKAFIRPQYDFIDP